MTTELVLEQLQYIPGNSGEGTLRLTYRKGLEILTERLPVSGPHDAAQKVAEVQQSISEGTHKLQ